MTRHRDYVPHGVIPAVLLPFHEDLSIDEASYRAHLRDVASVDGISAITTNAHASEVAACTFDEQRRVLALTQDEIGARLPIVNGIYAESALEGARIAKMAHEGGASALLVFRSAWAKDCYQDRVTREAAMAKLYATEAAQRIIDDAVQILGGRGVMADHPVDLLYRSIRALRIYEGTTEIQHLIIAGMLVAEAKAEEEPSPRGAGSDGGASR